MSSAPDQFRLAYPAYRVFIFGIEISDDVLDVKLQMHDGSAPNQCTITLNNELDKYIITTSDMMALSNVDPSKFKLPWLQGEEFGDMNIQSSLFPSNQPSSQSSIEEIQAFRGVINRNINQDRKRQILDKKYSVIQEVSSADRTDILNRPLESSTYTDYFGSEVRRYPLADGLSIFHPMDPVRVFMRDPFNPSRWYHMFCGFISDQVDQVTENSAKTVNVVCEDPTKLLRYSRMFINPGIVDAKAVIQDNDFRIQSFYAQAMSGYTLPEVFYTIIFGPDMIGAEKFKQQTVGPQADSSTSTKIRGVGHFSFENSVICTFGTQPSNPGQSPDGPAPTQLDQLKPPIDIGDSLITWQLLLDHEVQPSDLWTMNVTTSKPPPGTPLAKMIEGVTGVASGTSPSLDGVGGLRKDINGNILIDDVITYIGEHPEKYLVDGGRLMMLIPNSLGADNRDILTKDIIQAYPLQSEWSSAGKILYETVDRIQFVMYASPRGDIVVEPPLFDFDPDDFGMQPIKSDAVQSLGNQYPPISHGESKFPGNDRGPYGPKYVILKRDTFNWESAIVDEKVYTIAVTKKAIFQNWESLPYSDLVGDLKVVKLPDLIPLYGTRQAPLTPRGYINTDDGAELYGQITLNRLNADAHTLRVAHTPNIQMWVNRPIYIQGRNVIATTKSISHSLTWGQAGSMETNTEFFAARTWNGQIDESGRPVFTSIGGYGSRPLNYAMLFKKRTPPIKDNSAGVSAAAFSLQARNRIGE